MNYYVYFAKSKKNLKVYVGSTSKQPKDRIKVHNNGSNKWSSYNGTLELIYYEKYSCKKDALSREKFYKSGFGKMIKGVIIDKLSNIKKL